MAHSDMNGSASAARISDEREVHHSGSGAPSLVEYCRSRAVRMAGNAMLTGQLAYTLLEILVVVAIIGILAAIAVPAYNRYVERVRVAQAVGELTVMSVAIAKYMDDNRAPPDTLAQVDLQGKLDPWNNPYVFTNLVGVNGRGSARKDKNLNPLNSDFDLYSVGKDGQSKLPLSPKVSQDDVLRARDGRFIGLAKDFDP